MVLGAAGSIVPAHAERGARVPSVILCPAVSGFLQGTPRSLRFGKHYAGLPVSGRSMAGGPLWGQNDYCPRLFCFPLLSFWLARPRSLDQGRLQVSVRNDAQRREGKKTTTIVSGDTRRFVSVLLANLQQMFQYISKQKCK